MSDTSNLTAKQNQADVLAGTILSPAGTDTAANGANVLTPDFAVGTASFLSDLTRDYMVYLTVTTAGTVSRVVLTDLVGNAHNVFGGSAGVSVAIGTMISFRLPAGWEVEVIGTSLVVADQLAISC